MYNTINAFRVVLCFQKYFFINNLETKPFEDKTSVESRLNYLIKLLPLSRGSKETDKNLGRLNN